VLPLLAEDFIGGPIDPWAQRIQMAREHFWVTLTGTVLIALLVLWIMIDARKTWVRFSGWKGRPVVRAARDSDPPFTDLEAKAQAVLDELLPTLPPEVLAEARQVPIVFEERSPLDKEKWRILGIYQGFTEGRVSPGKGPIILYLRNIDEWCADEGHDFNEEVRVTYLHELGHHLGWNESDVRRREL
jgi:predicted Zn-dependent protease with MMP-like domain